MVLAYSRGALALAPSGRAILREPVGRDAAPAQPDGPSAFDGVRVEHHAIAAAAGRDLAEVPAP